MDGRQEVINRYYEGHEGGLWLPEYYAGPESIGAALQDSNAVHERKIGPFVYDEAKDPDPAAVDAALEEVSKNLRLAEYGGSSFEISVANAAADGPVMLHISTYSSALTTNPGNAYEFAAQAARYPGYTHLYVGSFGNGGTSPLLPSDAKYARKTGRFTWENDEGGTVALQSIQNLLGALRQDGLINERQIRIMGTDSAGGHYARALAVEMESGQLDSAFFSETSGFVNLSIPRIMGGILLVEGLRNAKSNRELSPDPEKMNAQKQDRAREALANHEYSETEQRMILMREKEQVGSPLTTISSLWTSMQALRRGPKGENNPLVADTNALLARHPAARVTYGMAERDPLYRNPETSREAASEFLGNLLLKDEGVRIISIPEMTHAYNTYFPALYHAIKAYALDPSSDS